MVQYKSEHNLPIPVEQVARLVHRFDRRQEAQLLRLVSEFLTIRPEEADFFQRA